MSDNNESILNSVKGEITISFDKNQEAKVIYQSILLELNTSPDYRSKADISLKDNKLTISIEATDMTSFRASVNSIIKWIKLSHEMIEISTI
jgi:KEOPS complex subunit Pcc1